MFNFTLAHAPLTAGTLAERSAPSVALCERATPLVRKTLRQIMEEDGRLKKALARGGKGKTWQGDPKKVQSCLLGDKVIVSTTLE